MAAKPSAKFDAKAVALSKLRSLLKKQDLFDAKVAAQRETLDVEIKELQASIAKF